MNIPGEIKLKVWIFPDVAYNGHHWIMKVKLYKGAELITPIKNRQLGPEYYAEYIVESWYEKSYIGHGVKKTNNN